MASFTDQLTHFNPYVKDFSTEAYVTAGMYKQQKYDTNVQKINSYVQSLYGFNVARDVDKQYLQQKVGGFTEGLNKYLSSADFSNDSLVNQVGGYAGQIANDKYIQNAVYSTAKMQKDLGTLDAAKKDGKNYSPANEYKLMQDVNKYMQGDINTAYQSEGYIPAINAEEEITKAWKDKHPNARLEKRIGLDGSSGWVMVTEQGEKGISAEQVMQDIESTIDPRIRKQIAIDANYKLAGVNMDEYISSQYKDYQDYLDENIKSLASRILTATSTDKPTLEAELKKFGDRKKETLDDFNKTLEFSRQNPDAVKDQLYYRQWLKGISSKISYSETTFSNLIYKDYYDIQDKYYDRLNGGKKPAEQKSSTDGAMIDLPISDKETQGQSLNDLKNEVLTQKQNITDQWNELATKLLSDTYESVGLSTEAEKIKEGNRILYYSKDGQFITPVAFNKLNPEQKKLYSRGNVAKNQVFKDGQASNIYTVKNPTILNGLYKQLRADYDNGKQVPLEVKEFFDNNLQAEIENAAKAQAVVEMENQLKKEGLDVKDFPKITAQQKAREAQNIKNLSAPSFSPTALPSTGYAGDSPDYSKKVKEREKREAELIRNYQGVQNRREIVLEKGKSEDEKNINQLITAIGAINRTSGQSNFRGIDWKKVDDFLGSKETTSYAYGQNPDGTSYVALSNQGERIEVPLDKITAQGLSLYEEDPLRVAKNIRNLKGGTMGTSPLQAIPVQYGGKYKVSYLLDRLPSGNYKLQMFLGAGSNNGQLRFKDEDKSYSEAELRQVLQSVNDGAVENYINHLKGVEQGTITFDPKIKPFNIIGNSLQLPTFGGSNAIPTFPGVNQ